MRVWALIRKGPDVDIRPLANFSSGFWGSNNSQADTRIDKGIKGRGSKDYIIAIRAIRETPVTYDLSLHKRCSQIVVHLKTVRYV